MSNEPYISFLLQILWKNFNFQEVLIFGSCVTCPSKFMFLWRLWPWKHSHIPCGEWEFYNIGQNPSSSIFMKVPLCTSVASVFIELQNLFPSKNDRTRLIFTRPWVVLTRNRDFKTAVDLLESKLYTWKFSPFHKSKQIIFSKWRLAIGKKVYSGKNV